MYMYICVRLLKSERVLDCDSQFTNLFPFSLDGPSFDTL